MITKLFWVSFISRLLYVCATIVLLVSVVLSVSSKDFIWQAFLWAFGLWFNGLLLDVVAEIGKAIMRMESEQVLIRTWVQQFRS
jgi:small-conductance mechanosensitive channel